MLISYSQPFLRLKLAAAIHQSLRALIHKPYQAYLLSDPFPHQARMLFFWESCELYT